MNTEEVEKAEVEKAEVEKAEVEKAEVPRFTSPPTRRPSFGNGTAANTDLAFQSEGEISLPNDISIH